MRSRALLALLGLLGYGAGCGDNFSAADFPAEQRDATCGYYVRCGAFANVAECRSYFARSMPDNPSLQAALEAGKIHYSGPAAQDCIDALDNLDCDYTLQDPGALAACEEVFTGTGMLGATCAFDGECISERCVVPDCGEACCHGTCGEPRPYPDLDEPCPTGVCAPGLFCGIDELCHAELGLNAPCNAFMVCAYPLYCSPSRGACTERPHTGEVCEGYCALEGDVCGLGARCIDAGVGGDECASALECSHFYYCNLNAGKCMLPEEPIRLPNDSPCTFSSECMSRYCDAICTDVPICF